MSPKWSGARACAIITARQPKSRGGPSRPPPTSPTTHVVASSEKARSRRTTAARGPVPYQVSVTLARPKPRARKIRPSKGAITDQWSPKPARRERAPQMPSIQRITDQQLEGRFDRAPMSPADVKKMGAPSCHPAMALLIRGSKPDPRRVRTGAPDQQSQGRRGRAHLSLSSSSPARGRPTCRVQEPMRVASRGIPSRESFRALGPQRDRALPSKPT
jgi:hypothetical protein